MPINTILGLLILILGLFTLKDFLLYVKKNQYTGLLIPSFNYKINMS